MKFYVLFALLAALTLTGCRQGVRTQIAPAPAPILQSASDPVQTALNSWIGASIVTLKGQFGVPTAQTDDASGGTIYEYDIEDGAWIDVWTFYVNSSGIIYRDMYSQKRGAVILLPLDDN